MPEALDQLFSPFCVLLRHHDVNRAQARLTSMKTHGDHAAQQSCKVSRVARVCHVHLAQPTGILRDLRGRRQ
eukprot:CAMPEP_0168420514 /NCGR_PEP_ID=MMETSP0228-20121227/32813_1 /TAXON_ID=133427 /ORGANISM="Protoceratium reticulatum, Strain CCCM 535 (=CCMP 1889)" /LENGTH=71 /DNA_ID=CAMNT_0008434409 /DNA_START=836 /DNA_END=1051 /DNA_ORIENTATION=+